MKIRVEFDVRIPDGFTNSDIDEYLRFTYGDNGNMKHGNRLDEENINAEPIFGSFTWRRVSASPHYQNSMAANEAKIREACKKLDSRKTHRIDRIRMLAGIEHQAFDDTLAKLAMEGIIEMTWGDTSQMTAEQIEGLYSSGDDDLPLVNLVWQ